MPKIFARFCFTDTNFPLFLPFYLKGYILIEKGAELLKLMAIDGNSIVNRAFFGIRHLTASDGTPTNAVYGYKLS